MHYQGIQLLRSHEIALPGPDNEVLFTRYVPGMCADALRSRAVTIIATDAQLPLNQRCFVQERYSLMPPVMMEDMVTELSERLRHKGVQRPGFIVHTALRDVDMLNTGIVSVNRDAATFRIEAAKGVEGNIRQFCYTAHLDGPYDIDTRGAHIADTIGFSARLREEVTQAALHIPGNPQLSFVVYRNGKDGPHRVMYTDVWLQGGRVQQGILICDAQ